MQTYHTQMEAARKHIITPQMKTVAEKERVDVEWLLPFVCDKSAFDSSIILFCIVVTDCTVSVSHLQPCLDTICNI